MKEKTRKILKRFFFLSPLKTILIAIPLYALVIYVLIKGGINPWIDYLVYILSAYALVITVTGIGKIVKCLKTGIRQNPVVRWLLEMPVIGRILRENVFRTRVILYPGLIINIVYVGIKLYSGIYYQSAWFVSLAVYYFALALMRFSLLWPGRRRTNESKQKVELEKYRLCGGILFLLNLAMSGMVILAVTKNAGFTYSGMLIYLMAMYTFYSVITAVINIIKYRKYGRPVLSAAKVISFTTALVSLFSLETAMLSQFSTKDQMAFRKIMTACTGGAVCLIVVSLALYMIVSSTKKLKCIQTNG